MYIVTFFFNVEGMAPEEFGPMSKGKANSFVRNFIKKGYLESGDGYGGSAFVLASSVSLVSITVDEAGN